MSATSAVRDEHLGGISHRNNGWRCILVSVFSSPFWFKGRFRWLGLGGLR